MYYSTTVFLEPKTNVRMKLPKWNSNHPDGVCLAFHFYMHGSDSSRLSVFYDQSAHIWHQSYDQGDLWRNESFTMTNLMTKAVVFSASAGKDGISDIVLDDISVTDGPCSVPTSECDFSSLCTSIYVGGPKLKYRHCDRKVFRDQQFDRQAG
jgi:hypothetical protein